ncbi:Uu.00g098330.m01.CDS01 [Anthostomella pinea]|uniref:Uu.00g098330.m01.CDS01 n=1 Tax=Anthostomella pinea TaxID=933095 RepID=A0AAI8YCQ2_9PEZI|nr:Uu.00g098330.m01.CDS01 [Anthostomella pinea]
MAHRLYRFDGQDEDPRLEVLYRNLRIIDNDIIDNSKSQDAQETRAEETNEKMRQLEVSVDESNTLVHANTAAAKDHANNLRVVAGMVEDAMAKTRAIEETVNNSAASIDELSLHVESMGGGMAHVSAEVMALKETTADNGKMMTEHGKMLSEILSHLRSNAQGGNSSTHIPPTTASNAKSAEEVRNEFKQKMLQAAGGENGNSANSAPAVEANTNNQGNSHLRAIDVINKHGNFLHDAANTYFREQGRGSMNIPTHLPTDRFIYWLREDYLSKADYSRIAVRELYAIIYTLTFQEKENLFRMAWYGPAATYFQ